MVQSNTKSSLLARRIQSEALPKSTDGGVYSQYFTPEEKSLLASIAENDVTDEINLLRVLLARRLASVPESRDE